MLAMNLVNNMVDVMISPEGMEAMIKQGKLKRPAELAADSSEQPQVDWEIERDGLDLWCEVPITLAQAMMGSKVKVRTADNRRVVLKIPAGTQSGTTFRIKGQGVEKGEKRGDQLVKVVVKLPETLTDEGREALEKLVEVEDLRH